MTDQPQADHAAWEEILAAMEAQVSAAEAAVADQGTEASDIIQPDAWTAPTGVGPLPAALASRVEELLVRQQGVATLLKEAARGTRRVDRAIARLNLAQPRPPVYVDLPA